MGIAERDHIYEKIKISYSGGCVAENEIDLEILAKSLLSLNSLISKTNNSLNGRDSKIAIKLKGGFEKGSVVTDIYVHYIAPLLPAAPDIIKSIMQLIKLKCLLKGDKPKNVEEKQDGTLTIHSSDGSTLNINAPVYYISNNSGIINDLGGVMQPLKEGIDNIQIFSGEDCLDDNNDKDKDFISVTKEQKDYVIPKAEDFVSDDTCTCYLELQSVNLDGTPKNWKFYDLENDVTFTASVNDSEFLNDVTMKKYSFKSGDVIHVELRTIKKTVNARKRTERYIERVIGYNESIEGERA